MILTHAGKIWLGAAFSFALLAALAFLSYFAGSSMSNTTQIAVLETKIDIVQSNMHSHISEIKEDVQYIRQRVDEIADRN